MSRPGQSSQQPGKKSAGERFAELGPAWIASIGTLIVALTGAGFFAGRVTVTASSPPPKVITKTVTITASAPATAASSPSGTPTASPAASSDGELLGSYTITLPRDGSATLGPTKPTAQQILASSGGDIIWDYEDGGAPLSTGSGDQMVGLANGTTPTYQACKNSTLATNSESSNPGTAFCIIETTGRMAGITVKSVDIGVNPVNIVLNVLVWSNSP
jgi:hypothetical protein